jgi:hypothetical protein
MFGEWGTVELIAYYRISTARQGESGLDLEAKLVECLSRWLPEA